MPINNVKRISRRVLLLMLVSVIILVLLGILRFAVGSMPDKDQARRDLERHQRQQLIQDGK